MANLPMTSMLSGHVEAPTLASSDIETLALDTSKISSADSPRPIHGWRWGLAGMQDMLQVQTRR